MSLPLLNFAVELIAVPGVILRAEVSICIGHAESVASWLALHADLAIQAMPIL